MQRHLSRALPLVLSLFLLALLPSCRFGSSAAEAQGYTLVYLKTGAKTGLSKEESQTIFAGHFANMQRLAGERKLLLAGPFGKQKHDEALRGLFILDTADPAEARAWAETDPGFQAQVFVLEYHPLRTQAALRALLERELAVAAEDQAAGRQPDMAERLRNYVLLTSSLGAEMEEQLAGESFTLLRGRLEGGMGWAILDAKDPEAALEQIGAAREHMGEVALDSWFATRGIEELPNLVDG